MTKEKYEAIIDEKLKAVKQELMAEYKEEEPSLDGWKVGDRYFYRDSIGKIYKSELAPMPNGTLRELDIYKITHGYAKHTEEEVQFQIERDAVLYELSKFAEPKDREWNGKIKHYYIYWNWERDIVDIDYNNIYRHTDIYFAAEEDAKKAIRIVGGERVKKYYLGVDF